jgi:transcriptional regulator with XRE-family HTH domain
MHIQATFSLFHADDQLVNFLSVDVSSIIFVSAYVKAVLCNMMSAFKTSLQSSFCNNIKNLRHERSWNQAELAQYLGLSVAAVSKIESGRTNITVSYIEQLAKIYDLSPVRLLKTDNSPLRTLDTSQLTEVKKKLAKRESEILDLQKKIIELYEELQCVKAPA